MVFRILNLILRPTIPQRTATCPTSLYAVCTTVVLALISTMKLTHHDRGDSCMYNIGSEDDPEAWQRPSLADERSHPNHWYNRASDLHATAGATWYAMGAKSADVARDLNLPAGFSMSVACWPVYHMLCGLALEVIMKAALVQRGFTPTQYEQHGLNKLTRLLEIEPSPSDAKLLDFYNASLVWAGRYPTPRRATDEKIRDHWDLTSEVLTSSCPNQGEGKINKRQSNSSTEWTAFTSLWLRYAALFEHSR